MGVTVKIEEIKELMRKALALRGITGEYAEFMISDYLESELEGHRTHGLSKFLTVDAGLSRRSGEMKLLKQKGCYAQVDGNGELGHIAALYSTNLAIAAAKEHGVGITALKNVGRYSRITPYARKISGEGLVGMITNNGGPACVAPFGGAKAMFGTNPLCFSFPSGRGKPYVFDFATSQKVWGEVRQAIVENRPLPDNCFIDGEGNFTTDPEKAEAGVPFGGPKGYALCYALEVMTGAFVGAKMGYNARDEYDLGYLFVAFSPEMFTTLNTFTEEVDALAGDVRGCPPMKPGGQVFVPGEIFGSRPVSQIPSDEAEVEEDVYRRLKIMSVSLEGGYENNKKLN